MFRLIRFDLHNIFLSYRFVLTVCNPSHVLADHCYEKIWLLPNKDIIKNKRCTSFCLSEMVRKLPVYETGWTGPGWTPGLVSDCVIITQFLMLKSRT